MCYQAELVDRMRIDLCNLRSGIRVAVRSRADNVAIEVLDQWISSIVAELTAGTENVEELQLLALEWQLRRSRFLVSDIADVIVVDS